MDGGTGILVDKIHLCTARYPCMYWKGLSANLARIAPVEHAPATHRWVTSVQVTMRPHAKCMPGVLFALSSPEAASSATSLVRSRTKGQSRRTPPRGELDLESVN